MTGSSERTQDRLVMNAEVVENTRSETYEDFEQILSECFGIAYDEIEINVTEATDAE